jgi:hypothetical protein
MTTQKVTICAFLTTDPKNKQGRTGTIINIEVIDEDNSNYTIEFEDGVIGIYQSGTFEILK